MQGLLSAGAGDLSAGKQAAKQEAPTPASDPQAAASPGAPLDGMLSVLALRSPLLAVTVWRLWPCSLARPAGRPRLRKAWPCCRTPFYG